MPLKRSNVYFIRMLCLLHAFGHGDAKRKKKRLLLTPTLRGNAHASMLHTILRDSMQ